ncbi:hypothetical protein EFM06_01190 [Lactobacillus helveticus]|uniref:hypothetical protein n=1 Tax=Lactobacillus helveticus TaxID=1587 RepID=UPI0021823149|nr:hypothetical protein [Lactobacillus helveticus]MCT0196514.1 hypothetical protein [Lactobacillus helveticus]
MMQEDLGKTKLDHVLSYIVIAAMKFLEFASILFLPLLIVQQTVLYGENHPYKVIPLLIALMLIISAYAVKLIKDWRRK